MRYVQLGSTELRSSVLGFGCASVMGSASRRDSLRALAAAWDAGITFFDTARSYGYGESEALLGEFLAGRRDQVVISTKFGILPARQPPWKQMAKSLARGVFSVFPGARKVVRRQIAAQFTHNQFTVDILRKSLHESLRRLRTDYVDLLFMHSPPLTALAQEDLLCELENLTRIGKIRFAGISAVPELLASPQVTNSHLLRAVQFPSNLLNLEQSGWIIPRPEDGRIAVANLPFGGIDGIARSRSKLDELAAAPGIAPELRRKLNEKDIALLPDVVFNIVTRNTGLHVVVPSMMRVPHLRANVQAITQSRFSEDEVAWMRATVCALNLASASPGR